MEESKRRIVESTIFLIEKYNDNLGKLTIREICKKTGVSIGLINYHFNSKEKLIEICVNIMINGIVEKFVQMTKKSYKSAFQKLEDLSLLTFSYLFEHKVFAKISILSDLRCYHELDNSHKTVNAYLPLVREALPNHSMDAVRIKTVNLIATMQMLFLRAEYLNGEFGINIFNESERKEFHSKMLKEIIYGG